MENNSFNVINQTASWEQTVEKSRFIAIVHHVTNLDEVAACLQAVRVEYPNARHYVYAYRLKERLLEKSTDDGEPQGTGGKQVLEQLQHRRLWDILVVVVRYFGGILLGTGGLSRAYSGTVKGLLERSCLESVRQHILYDLCIPYSHYEALKYQFNNRSWTLKNERFGEFIDINAYIPQNEEKEFEEWLQEYASGRIKLKNMGVVWK